jgi:predicted nuclease of predicted toxin-antitoxin system
MSNHKILIDEMDDGWDEKLKQLGFDAYSVKKLRAEGKKLRTDYSVINYARENDMILVTRDTESGQACKENNLPYILLDNEEIFKIVLNKINQL